jgi:hypothetical protein
MKYLKIVISVVLGRFIHVAVKAAFPLTSGNPDTAFMIGAFAGGLSMLAGFGIVYGLARLLSANTRKRDVTCSKRLSEKAVV